MARYQIRRSDDGRGPYRWEHVVRTKKGLTRGTICDQGGDDLTEAEANALRASCEEARFDVREAEDTP